MWISLLILPLRIGVATPKSIKTVNIELIFTVVNVVGLVVVRAVASRGGGRGGGG